MAGAHAAVNHNDHGNIILWSAWADDQFFASPGSATFTTTWDPEDLVFEGPDEPERLAPEYKPPGTQSVANDSWIVDGQGWQS